MIPGRPEGSQLPHPVLIDTDPGIDDALALFLAWGTPDFRVEAITTVAGNVDVDLATTNVFRLLAAVAAAPSPAPGTGGAGPPSAAPHHGGACPRRRRPRQRGGPDRPRRPSALSRPAG